MVQLTVSFPLGSLVRISAVFTANDGTGSKVDPDSVTCKTKPPTGIAATLVYPTDAALVRGALGEYHVDVNANAAGAWSYRFESAGAGQAAAEGKFQVTASAF